MQGSIFSNTARETRLRREILPAKALPRADLTRNQPLPPRTRPPARYNGSSLAPFCSTFVSDLETPAEDGGSPGRPAVRCTVLGRCCRSSVAVLLLLFLGLCATGRPSREKRRSSAETSASCGRRPRSAVRESLPPGFVSDCVLCCFGFFFYFTFPDFIPIADFFYS